MKTETQGQRNIVASDYQQPQVIADPIDAEASGFGIATVPIVLIALAYVAYVLLLVHTPGAPY